MYDPKFSQKQMYDQYGSSFKSSNKKVDPKPSKSSGFGGMGPDPAERFGGSPTRGIGAKPPSTNTFGTNTFGGGQDNNPNRDESENKSTVAKVYEKAVDFFQSFGADKPKDVIVDGKRVYQGPAFRGYDPTTRIGEFGGEYGKKNYFLGIEKLGIPTYPRTDVPATLPPSTINVFGTNTDNPRLNMFGVNRGFTGGPEGLDAPTMTQPAAPATASSSAMIAGINRILKEVIAPNSKEYKIKRGDTLSSIAVREGVTVDDLVKINGIEDKNKIYAGDSIIIPKPEEVDRAKEFVLRVTTRGDNLDPDSDFYQSGVPMDKRDFAPEDTSGFGGMGPDPSTGQGIMSPDYDTVEKAQERLNDLGYTTLVGPLAVDGDLGLGTARQLRKFQATAGIPITGELDEATQKALKKNSNKNKEGKDPSAVATDLSEALFQQIKKPIAEIESGGESEPYATVGGDADDYDGKYQFGWRAKQDLRNNPAITNSERAKLFHVEDQFNENDPSRIAFRADANLQEKAFRLYVNQNHDTLTRNSAKYRAMDDKNKLAVLGYAHNQGAENALEWLTTTVSGTDAFGTRGDRYSDAVVEELSERKKGK